MRVTWDVGCDDDEEEDEEEDEDDAVVVMAFSSCRRCTAADRTRLSSAARRCAR